MENQKENVVQSDGIHGKCLTYAYDKKRDKLLYIDDVPNGAKCGCFCPCCGESLVAKNGGEYRVHHFAHSSGCDCNAYYETALHRLAKEIIKEEKCVMLPTSELSQFESVVIEKYDADTGLTPDCFCKTEEGSVLWIEIIVSNPPSKEKVRIIDDRDINCLIIDVSEQTLDKVKLRDFIVNSIEFRNFVKPIEVKRLQNKSQHLPQFRSLSSHEIVIFKEITEIQRITLKDSLISCYHRTCYGWTDEEWEIYIHGNPFKQ